MPRLGVNLDHVATIRELRKTPYPDLWEAYLCAKRGGADQITVHLREDRRHIQEKDVRLFRDKASLPLNLEMAATPAMVAFARAVRPALVTLVPEKRQELTTEGGLDLQTLFHTLQKPIEELLANHVPVSLFIDPDINQVDHAQKLGVSIVELHTGCYALASSDEVKEIELMRLNKAAHEAKAFGLKVSAGHGLHYDHMKTFISRIPVIEEYNIGHSLIARALFVGLERAIREMKQMVEGA